MLILLHTSTGDLKYNPFRFRISRSLQANHLKRNSHSFTMRVVTKDTKFLEVDETIVVAAMAGDASFPSNSRAPLGSLNSAQLCQLFDHCFLYNLEDFVVRNNLIGILHFPELHVRV